MMTTTEKLAGLREKMKETGVDAYVITTDDFHASEYVGAYFREREYVRVYRICRNTGCAP